MGLTKIIDEKIEERLLVLSLAIMVVLIFFQVVFRQIGTSLYWADELSRYLHIAQVWIGASLAVRKGEHVRISFFRNLFSNKIRMIIDIISIICWFGFALFIAIEGTKVVNGILHTGQVSSSMGIPMWIPYLVVPIGGVLISIRLIQQLVIIFRTPQQEKELV